MTCARLHALCSLIHKLLTLQFPAVFCSCGRDHVHFIFLSVRSGSSCFGCCELNVRICGDESLEELERKSSTNDGVGAYAQGPIEVQLPVEVRAVRVHSSYKRLKPP